MSRLLRRLSPCLLAILLLWGHLQANASDETSQGDKLRILYSSRFTFAKTGVPLVTVEIMSGQKSTTLRSKGGLIVLPDGEGGPSVIAADTFSITLKNPKAAKLMEWTVVATHSANDNKAIARDIKRWKKRGHRVETFDIGTLFAVEGSVMDTRQVRIAIDPVSAPKGEEHARTIQKKYDVSTEVHAELIRRPQGQVVAKANGVTIANSSVLWFTPAKRGNTVEVLDVITGHGGSQLKSKREHRRYFGSVYVTIGQDGQLTVANAVTASDLLAGLVPSEMFPTAPEEALKAQSIAARTELLQKLGTRHLGDPFLLCSSQHCQVYSGAGKEHPRTTKAVKATRGQVLLRNSGGLVDARYSATCGGHTEHKHHIWGGEKDSSLVGHYDSKKTPSTFKSGVTESNLSSFLSQPTSSAFCGATPFSKGRFRWKATLDSNTLLSNLKDKGIHVGHVLSLTPQKRGISGRIIEMGIKGDQGQTVIYGDLKIRRMLGGLRSSLFTVKSKGSPKRPTAFEFRGAGFGHGVGMCQLGAIGMATSGQKAKNILEHYYHKAKLTKIY